VVVAGLSAALRARLFALAPENGVEGRITRSLKRASFFESPMTTLLHSGTTPTR
jgi:hypothetical protein